MKSEDLCFGRISEKNFNRLCERITPIKLSEVPEVVEFLKKEELVKGYFTSKKCEYKNLMKDGIGEPLSYITFTLERPPKNVYYEEILNLYNY
jgi:hypothetical protein